MIRLEVVDNSRMHFVVKADEPITIESDGDSGVTYIYRGVDTTQTSEPVGAYDVNLGDENTTWEA